MPKKSAEVVVKGLKKILICEEGLHEEIHGKFEKLIAKLHKRNDDHLDCDDPDAQRLEDGFLFFKKTMFDKHPDLFSELAESQHPKFLVFACSDSRVSPTTVLHFKPGEAFVGRNIGNMVPTFDWLRHTEVGSVIEYAVKELKVENILIMGHSHCGGIERLMSLQENSSHHTHTFDFLDEWVKIGLPAKIKVKEEANHLSPEKQLTLLEKESVKNSMANLLTYPFVRDAVMNGSIILRGGYYDFVDGTFEQWKVCTGPMPPTYN